MYVVVDLEGVSIWCVALVRHVVISHPHIPASLKPLLANYSMVIVMILSVRYPFSTTHRHHD